MGGCDVPIDRQSFSRKYSTVLQDKIQFNTIIAIIDKIIVLLMELRNELVRIGEETMKMPDPRNEGMYMETTTPTAITSYDQCVQLRTLFQTISLNMIAEIQNRILAIQIALAGCPGAGLSSGTLVDLFINEYLKKILPTFVEFHTGEADGKCGDIIFSLKFVGCKKGSSLALDWSKNPSESSRERFTCPICIIILHTGKWWTRKNLSEYTDTVHSGLYFVDPSYCKENITLSSNNKTNTLITREQVYKMVQHAKTSGNHIPFPDEPVSCRFIISNAFVQL